MIASGHVDDARKKVWVAFADHFLDTETRHDLPLAALAAVQGGFTVEEASHIWCYEVTPVVGPNLWSVAGDWAGWDSEWLVEQITTVVRARSRPPGIGEYLAYRWTVHFNHACWVAIERLMRALLAAEPPARNALANDLAALARHYFDFVPRALDVGAPGRREELRRLFSKVFLPALRPTVSRLCGELVAVYAERVEKALGG